jgi:hypothetical protein
MLKIVEKQGYASPIDVLVEIMKLSTSDVEQWRLGKIPYLERAIQLNLAQLNVLLIQMSVAAQHMELKASWTAYHTWGRGPHRSLRFTKSGDRYAERRYATHFVRPLHK